MKRLHFQSLAAKASETKKDELELDLRIRHYHSAKKTNNVNHRNTAYSLKYTEKNCEGTSGNVFWTKIKAQERASFQNISPTMADFCAVVSTLLFGVSFCLESGSQVERQKRQKAYLNSKKKKKIGEWIQADILALAIFFLLFCLLSPTAKPGRRLG